MRDELKEIFPEVIMKKHPRKPIRTPRISFTLIFSFKRKKARMPIKKEFEFIRTLAEVDVVNLTE